MNNDRIQYLLHLYLDDSCTAAELNELKLWLMNPDHEAYFNEFLEEVWQKMDQENLKDLSKEKTDLLFNKITAQPQKHTNTFRLWPRIAAAAVLLISLGSIFFFYAKAPEKLLYTAKKAIHVATPEHNNAVLTLADGSIIPLSTEKKGVQVNEGNQLVYTDGSTIVNPASGENAADELMAPEASNQYAVLSIPKGTHYEIVLADGTKVWLNADSKLKYPARFDKKFRIVELEGEGYFEVTKSKDRPFIVKSKGQEVMVLGTEFNIAAYEDDEVIKTTLVGGSVKVRRTAGSNDAKELLLRPGQQSAVTAEGKDMEVSNVDVNEATDWKEGLFLFNNEAVKSIMKRLSRWYNVEIVYRGNVDNIRFTGSYSRTKNLKNLLKNMEQTGKVIFRIENDTKGKERRIIVTNNY